LDKLSKLKKSLMGSNNMLNLNEKLKDIYMTYRNHENPPVPLDTIREYLELEGVELDESENKCDAD
jgi:hypothetical protein